MSLELALQENTLAVKELTEWLKTFPTAATAISVPVTQVAEPKSEPEQVKEIKTKPDKNKVEKPTPSPEPEPEIEQPEAEAEAEAETDEFEDPEAEGSIPKLPEGKRDRAYYDIHVMPYTSKLGKMELDKNQATLRKIITQDFKSPKGGFQIPAEDWDALVYEVKKAIAELEATASDIA